MELRSLEAIMPTVLKETGLSGFRVGLAWSPISNKVQLSLYKDIDVQFKKPDELIKEMIENVLDSAYLKSIHDQHEKKLADTIKEHEKAIEQLRNMLDDLDKYKNYYDLTLKMEREKRT